MQPTFIQHEWPLSRDAIIGMMAAKTVENKEKTSCRLKREESKGAIAELITKSVIGRLINTAELNTPTDGLLPPLQIVNIQRSRLV